MWLVPFRSQKESAPAVRRDPFGSLFDELFGPGFFEAPFQLGSRGRAVEKEGEYHFAVPVPGAESKDVEVEVHDDVLSVRARLDEGEGQMQSTFWLPQDADQEKISATVKNGLARIVVPKKESAKPRRIEVH